ncbi:MAG: 7-carboxy-7-deazaguanine synthase QueE [Legionella sp.]
MFGKNERVGKRFFNNTVNDQLLVTSRFFTLQGEGPYRGYPAYFIRLAKCNLACSFCDTYFDQGDWQTFSTILAEADNTISSFFSERHRIVPPWATGLSRKIILVITGGEPSLQENVSAFLQQAKDYFQYQQIESNGTRLLANLPQSTTLVISPKCIEKNGKIIGYPKPNGKVLERADSLKFVLAAPEDSHYLTYSQVPGWAHEWAVQTQKPVFISPMNCYIREPARAASNACSLPQHSDLNEIVSFWDSDLLDVKKNQRNHEYAAEYCMQYGFILNLQLHLYAGLP